MIPQQIVQPGHPIDLRPPQRLVRLREKAVDDVELEAATLVARFTREPVTLQDDGSRNSMPDVRIDYAGRPPAFMEVWNDIDDNYAAMWAKLMQRQHQLPNVVPAPRLHRVWHVTLGRTAHVGELEAEMVDLLGALEEAGETFEIVATEHKLRSSTHPSASRLLELGVVMLGSGPSDRGMVSLGPGGITGPAIVAWEPVLEWIADTLAGLADVRAKLAKTNAAERRVFLGVTYTSPGDVFFALSWDERTLPLEAPKLPSEITHLWLMNTKAHRCIAWFPDRGWFDPVYARATS